MKITMTIGKRSFGLEAIPNEIDVQPAKQYHNRLLIDAVDGMDANRRVRLEFDPTDFAALCAEAGVLPTHAPAARQVTQALRSAESALNAATSSALGVDPLAALAQVRAALATTSGLGVAS